MNNSSMSRRPAGPVRQHSLQQPPRRQQQIRRQRSTEDEKNIQIYSSSTVGSRNRYTSNANKCDHHHHHISMLDRPKVRVAWSEQPAQPKNNGVEIVARQIPTGKSSRPTTGRGNRNAMGRCPLAEKATILYSRQELAERLRLAWRQREENKSNIDIFLAHNTVEDRCESRLSTGTNLPTPKVQKKSDDSDQIQVPPENTNKDVVDVKKKEPECKDLEIMDDHKYQTWFTSFESNESSINISEDQTVDDNIIKTGESNEDNEGPEPDDEKEEDLTIAKKSSISINCNDWNTSVTISHKNENISSEPEIKTPSPIPVKEQPDYSQARLKRASYQSGLNKAFVGPIIEKPSTPRVTSRINSNITLEQQPRFRRTSSAPPQRRTQVNIVIDTPGISTSRGESERPRIMSACSTEQSQSTIKSSITTSRPIKSAPLTKRRSKANKRRGLSMSYSKDGEDEASMNAEDGRGGKAKGVKGSKSTLESKSADVVTMVSLVSSADSESEMDENSPRDDKLICELRNKLPTTPIIKSTNGLSGGMRKTFKSVSFQQDSFDYDSPPRYDESSPTSSTSSSSTPSTTTTTTTRSSLQARFVALSRANPEDTPLMTAATMTMTAWRAELCGPTHEHLPLLQLHSKPTTTSVLEAKSVTTMATSSCEAPLTDREKRCLAVPIGDIHDKKRKLVRCRSAVAAPRITDAAAEKQSSDTNQTCSQTEMRMSQIVSQASVILQDNNSTKVAPNPLMATTTDANLEKNKNLPAEPYCQTPKEKECWHLYRRMCDKGVFVSFDTVLRGMLTPTEYRLRQKEMSQNC